MTYELDARGDIRSQVLVGETVVLSEDECHGIVDSKLTACALKLAQKSSRWPIVIVRTTVVDSDVVAVKRQKDDRLFQARFINCRFRGVFSGIDFGQSHNVARDGDFGGVEGCDFTEAKLDGCRFFNVDVSSLRLPRWPHVVLLDFAQRAAEVAAMKWPGTLGNFMRICADQPVSLRVAVIYTPSLTKLVGCTEEQMREAFEQFGGVVV
jgi:hypothetical protein